MTTEPTEQPQEGRRGLWSAVVDSIKGAEIDFTRERLGRSILLLSIPMMLEMMMESVFAVVDVFFVMRLGAAAAATVGVTEAMLTLLYALAKWHSLCHLAFPSSLTHLGLTQLNTK